MEAAQGKSTLCESYTGDSLVKPFFDYDAHSQQETDDRQRFEQVCAPAIQQVLGVQRTQLAAATRSGWLADGRYKTSIRIFVQGLSLQAHQMNDVLALPAFSDPGWDKGIYPAPGKERLLAVVGGIKGKDGDSRILQPLEGELIRPFSDFLIQSLHGDETALEPRAAQRAKRSRATRPDQDKREAPACMGKSRLLPLTEQGMIQLASDAMKAKYLRGFRPHRVSGNSVQFVCDGVRSCPYAEMHKGNGCFCNFMPSGTIMYHCTSARCAQHDPMEIGEWEADPKAISLDDLPTESLRTFDAEVMRQLEKLADDWSQHKAAFHDTMIAYMNRLVIGRLDVWTEENGVLPSLLSAPTHFSADVESSVQPSRRQCACGKQ